jgi:hypothetical protein
MVVVTIKKKSNIKTMSGNEAVEIGGKSFLPPFLNLLIVLSS